MIQSVEIQNFKSIKSKFFPLRNLNVFLGLNGMGKSSFIQSLLLFRQSKEIHLGRLDLKGDYVSIGSTKDALYQYAEKSPFSIHLKFSEHKEINWKFDYKNGADYFTAQEKNEDEETNLSAILHSEALFSNDFQYINANRLEPKSVNDKNFTQVIDRKSLGNNGQYTAHYIEAFGGSPIAIEKLIHPRSIIPDSVTDSLIVKNSLIDQINFWMNEISPNVTIKTTSISSDYVLLEYEFEQPNFGYTNRFKPENVGFGITYVLPVVVSLLKSKPGDLLIIENPESHIHPRGQAELGQLIALTAMCGVQIILETHSDHIINGIRVAVKSKDTAIHIDKDKVVIFYFEKRFDANEQYAKITNIEIDANGELSDYPKDMLDEWNNQLMKLI